MGFSRRSFLKISAAIGAGIAAGQIPRLFPGGPQAFDELVVGEVPHRHEPEEFVLSVCGACRNPCFVLLRRIGEDIVGVRPASNDPLALKPCPRAYAIPQEIYHPDRIFFPLRSTGGKGKGAFAAISRSEAMQQIAQALRSAKDKVALVVKDDGGLSFRLLKAVGKQLQWSYVFTYEWPLTQGPLDAFKLGTGWRHCFYDFERTKGVISFGWDWLQGFESPAEAQRAFGLLRERNIPLWFVGPRLGLTGMRSDEWIACRPGYEALVALSLAHVIVKENWHDKEAEQLDGFSAFVQSLQRYDPARTQKQTGVSPEKVKKLAQQLAENKPCLCLTWRGRLQDQQAVVSLAALLGSVNKPGGMLVYCQEELPLGQQEEPLSVEDLPVAIEDGEVEVVILAGVNPVFTSPNPERWRKALSKAPLVVCLASIRNETTEWADIVLPLALPAERRDIYQRVVKEGERLRLEEVVVEAAVRDEDLIAPDQFAFEVLRLLGKEKEFPWKSLEEAADNLVSCCRVSNFNPQIVRFSFPSPFQWTEPAFSDGDFYLLLDTPIALPHGEGAHLPYLITTVGPHVRQWWTTYVEINPETAKRLRLSEKDLVVIESEAGSIEARVALYAGVPPDAVCLPIGVGHRMGHFAQKEGGNPMELLALRQDEATSLPLFHLQKVRIRRV